MADTDSTPTPDAPPVRKRPKPGERRVQILQALATMLEQPGAERITTAALAAKLDVSEAALYRHFASKAQMFEGLIEFIESSIFTLINQIMERDAAQAQQSATPTVDAQVRAALLVSFVQGRLQRHARSGFKRSALEHLEASLALML